MPGVKEDILLFLSFALRELAQCTPIHSWNTQGGQQRGWGQAGVILGGGGGGWGEREEAERRKTCEATADPAQTWGLQQRRLYRSDFAVPTLGTAVFLAFWYSCTIF